MSEDYNKNPEDSSDKSEKPAPESPKDHSPTKSERSSDSNQSTAMGNPMMLMMLLMFAVIILLIFTNFQKKGNNSSNADSKENPSITAAKADLEARRIELNRQRMAMNLPPLEGTAEPADDIASRLKRDADTLAALSESFRKMIADSNTQLNQRDSDILRLEQRQKDISLDNDRLRSELVRANTSNPEIERLKLLLAEVELQLADAKKELAASRTSFTEEEFKTMKRQFEETKRERDFYQTRLRETEAQYEKAAELFANNENELVPAAVEIFRRLRKMEGVKDSELFTEYSNLGRELGSSVLHTLSFATGSSELTAEDMTQLERIVSDEAPDGDLILIIGYASKTGDSLANQRLSSDRATKAAEYFRGRKRPGQKVQAVYLGQTDRFSSSKPVQNQICEVWRIPKK